MLVFYMKIISKVLSCSIYYSKNNVGITYNLIS